MTRETFQLLDGYMRSCVCDSMHDPTHIYRVLARALKIAETEPGVCPDVLIAACLLHDIARSEQYDDPRLCHAQEGGRKAAAFLRENGFEEPFIQKVCACIQTHRYRAATPPQSIEAKILFDADKLDAAGAMGIARTLMFQGKTGQPLYVRTADGAIDPAQESFYREYTVKLQRLYDRFYTAEGQRMARCAQAAAAAFFQALNSEADQAQLHAGALCAHLTDGQAV